MASANKKTCLLIIDKKFYSFERHIREALGNLNYDVTVANHEYPEGTIGKILGKLRIPLIFSITYKHIVKYYLDSKHYDVAIIIKGRGMSVELINKIKQSASFVVGYGYDSFKYNPFPLKWYKALPNYYTFDYKDGDDYNIPIVELFSSLKQLEDAPDKIIKYDLSALLRNHSQRLKYLDKVISILTPKSVFIYIFELNIGTFLINFVTNPFLYLKYWKYIHFKPLNYSNYNEVINSSAVTLDYAHHTQTGITIRCYESINLKTKIISNNKYLERSEYFNDTNALLFNIGDSEQEFLEKYKRFSSAPYNAQSRNIYNFLSDLLK